MLFSAPMVTAIADGVKTQTRRPINRYNSTCETAKFDNLDWGNVMQRGDMLSVAGGNCTFHQVKSRIQPGDRIYVKETGWERPNRTTKMMRDGADTWKPYYFDADGISENDREFFKENGFIRRPSILMPKVCARYWLEVVSVRPEQIQNISESDAKAEGVKPVVRDCDKLDYATGFYWTWGECYGNTVNGWDANPWVWRIEFRRA